MKILKLFFNILFILNIFIIISCASTPKTEELQEEQILDVLNDSSELENTQTDITSEEFNSETTLEQNLESQTQEQNPNSEENSQISVAEQNDELASLEEKIEEDILPELPLLLEEETENDADKIISEPIIEDEPQIQQINNQNKNEEIASEQNANNNDTTLESDIQKNDNFASNDSLGSTPKTELEENSSDKTFENTQSSFVQNENNKDTNTKNEITENSTETNSEELSHKSENSQLEKVSQIEEFEDDSSTNETINKTIKPSRSMTIKKNQYIDITYPGTGWIYLGQKDNKKDFTFFGRKLGGKDTSFTLRAKNPGTYLLHFYKNDPLTNSYIDDYLEVIVENKETSSTEHILAPNYATIVPPKPTITAETRKENKKQLANKTVDENKNKETKTQKDVTQNASSKIQIDSSVKTVIQTQEVEQNNEVSEKVNSQITETETKPKENSVQKKINQNLDSLKESELLALAKKQFTNKEHANALNTLEKFFEKAVSKIDEGLFLQGQILESKSDVQNIKGAIDSYELIVKSYPASAYWSQANKRTIFLKRFYINIR